MERVRPHESISNIYRSRYCNVTEQDPRETIIKSDAFIFEKFLEWVLNQANGKIASGQTVELHWSYLRMHYMALTGQKIDQFISKVIREVRVVFNTGQFC